MSITLRLFSPAPLRDRVADWLRMIGTWLMQLANRISPQKRHHRGEAPMFGGPALTLPTDLEIAFGGIKAAILQKLLEWINVNERKGQTLLDGHYWTYISYNTLQKNHFPTRHPDTLRKYIREMEKDGFIISFQPDPAGKKWYRLDMKAISKAVQMVGQTPGGVGQRSTGEGESPAPSGRITPPITSKTIKTKLQTKNTKPLTAATSESNTSTEIDVLTEADTDAVAAAILLPHPTIQSESGEYSIKAEAMPTNHEEPNGEPLAVREGHKDGSTTTALSKVPLKVLSPLAHELLVDFGILPTDSASLIDKYGEEHVRAGIRRTYAAKNIESPAGFLIAVLRKGDLLTPADLAPVHKLLHDTPTRFIPPADFVCTDEEREDISLIGFDRFVALRQAAEQALLELDIPAVLEASDPDAQHNLRTDGALV